MRIALVRKQKLTAAFDKSLLFAPVRVAFGVPLLLSLAVISSAINFYFGVGSRSVIRVPRNQTQ